MDKQNDAKKADEFSFDDVESVTCDGKTIKIKYKKVDAPAPETAEGEKVLPLPSVGAADALGTPEDLLKTEAYPYPKPETATTEPMTDSKKSVVKAKTKRIIACDSAGVKLDEMKFAMNDSAQFIIPDVVVCKDMIQDYAGKKVRKLAAELKKIVPFMDSVPITLEHPSSMVVTSAEEVKGYTLNPRFNEANNTLLCDLVIEDPIAIKYIREGNDKGVKIRDVSLGFYGDDIEEAGEVNGVKYDFVQKNLFPNHVALTSEGRCTLRDGCGIDSLDNAKMVDVPDEGPKGPCPCGTTLDSKVSDVPKIDSKVEPPKPSEKTLALRKKIADSTGCKELELEGKSEQELEVQYDMIMKAVVNSAADTKIPAKNDSKALKGDDLIAKAAEKKSGKYYTYG